MNNRTIQTTRSNDVVDSRQLLEWCRIPADESPGHPGLRIPYRQVQASEEMGLLMAEELAEVNEENNRKNLPTRAILPCGPKCWYSSFTNLVNMRSLSLRNLHVFHMDECLDWQGQLLPAHHPYNFRSFMERHFFGGVQPDFAVPERQRYWLPRRAWRR